MKTRETTMPSVKQLRKRLLNKLKELFQLDQPDLDFGFYRIMHAKAREVQNFIDTDLLAMVEEAFGRVDETREKELKAAYEETIRTAREFGVSTPWETKPVKKAKAAWDAIKAPASAEADVYDHLHRFFERYYDDGDFISRRYYTRETSGKAAPFAIPYNGEEVKLHWANADQYYIKTTEHFSRFSFDPRQAREVRASREDAPLDALLGNDDESPLKVHFRIVEAAEGEHDNIKASNVRKRFFLIHKERPVKLSPEGELVVHFEYRPDPDKSGQDKSWRDKRNAEAVETTLAALDQMARADKKKGTALAEYLRLLKTAAPTGKDKKRPLLARYINQYTARNTMDYFIHRDLGGFLRRELDFYIKNEVMRLDDIEEADAPMVETYLDKIKALRGIAGKLIDFLAQLEDFRKKLWLKKKFVVETNYCITLDRVREDLYPEIAANEAQHDEWVTLFAIDEIERELLHPEYEKPLTEEFLKANKHLVVDTRFFDEEFKARLIDSIDDFDVKCDGLLIHSENFQALNLMRERFREQVKCVYIDPPYNTGGEGFIYKDGYPDSTWLCCLESRLIGLPVFMPAGASLWINIDDNEAHYLKVLCDSIFGRNSFIAANIWQKRYSRENREAIGDVHDYIFTYSLTPLVFKEQRKKVELTEQQAKIYTNPNNDPRGRWRGIPMTAQGYRANQMYIITTPAGVAHAPPAGRCWSTVESEYKKLLKKGRIYFGKDNKTQPQIVRYLSEVEGIVPWTWWPHEEVGHTDESKKELYSLLGKGIGFDTPKPSRLLRRIIHIATDEKSHVLDYFAGSGSTAHAVIDLNRKDGGKRKYILVEMGDFFDTVLKPRVAKVVYSDSWKNGKPADRHAGASHCFKTIRLESYEDTLNNLRFDENPIRDKALSANASLGEDYMLRYMLEVETRGSQSLLNIDAFADPTAYSLNVKQSGSEEHVVRNVDLIETFNYLIGLRVEHMTAPRTFSASFRRDPDPELPEDQHTRLRVDGGVKPDADGPWWFRKIEGWTPGDPANPNNGQREKTLIVWRKLTGDLEKDNLVLDEWLRENGAGGRDSDILYVNGSNNAPNRIEGGKKLDVRLIEEEFMKRMWDLGSL